jgi:hypothetical protein
MKDKKSILGEIKDILFGAEKELIFKDEKSGDFILRVDGEDFIEGADISLVTPDGLIPVEDGTYPLEDGREVYVVGGKIDKIELPEVEEPEAEGAVEVEVEMEATEVELEAVVEAAPYVDETGEIKKEEPSLDDVMARLIKCEEIIAEMGKMNEKMNEFSKIVENKIDTFIKDTPADLEFKSMKSEFNGMLNDKKTTSDSNLEAIKNLRARK